MAEIISEVKPRFTLHVSAEELRSIEFALDMDGRYESTELYEVVRDALTDAGLRLISED